MAVKVGEVEYQVRMSDEKIPEDADHAKGTIESKLDALMGTVNKQFGWQLLKDIGGAFLEMGKQAASAFADISRAALDSVASYEQNVGGVETLFKDSADTVIANAERAYTTAGMSANEYMETVTSFSASLLQSLEGDTVKAASAADQAIVDMSDNANKMGTDIASIQNAYQGFAKQNYTMLDNLKLGYGGTKEEMARLIADANAVKVANGEMADLSIESFADVTEAIHIIQTEMGITGTTAKEASTTIEGSMNSAKAAWDNFLNGSISGEEFAQTAMTAATNIATNLATIIDNFAEQIPGMIEAFASALPELIGTLLPPILNALQSFGSAIFSVGGELLQKLAGGLVDKLPTMLESGGKAIESLTDGLMDKIPVILDTAGRLIMSLAEGLVAALPHILQSAIKLITSLVTYLIERAPQILQAGLKLIGQLAMGLLQALPEVWTAIGKIISALIKVITTTNWLKLGVDIIMGIVKGIASMAGAVVNALKNVLSGALDGVKKFLGIASPSRVFADQVGEMIPAGVSEGIDERTDDIDRSIEGMARRLVGGFDVNYNLPDIGGYASRLGASISAASSSTITVPVIIDGREVARSTAYYMDQQLAWEGT